MLQRPRPPPRPPSALAVKIVIQFLIRVDTDPLILPFRHNARHQLALVCKTWKDIIWSMPSLWDTIYFVFEDATLSTPFHDMPRQLRLCIQRAGGNSVTVIIKIKPGIFKSFDFFDRVISPAAHHIQRLYCNVEGNKEIRDFLRIPPGRFAAMKELDLGIVDSHHGQGIKEHDYLQSQVLTEVPMLRNACIRFSSVSCFSPNVLGLPMWQLTTLDLGSASVTAVDLLVILRSTRELKEGIFFVEFVEEPAPQFPLIPVTMKALQTLCLRLVYPSRHNLFFRIFEFPCLRHMWIELYNNYQEWDLLLYTHFIRTAANSLLHLKLSDFLPCKKGQQSQALQGNVNDQIPRQMHNNTEHTNALEGLMRMFPNLTNLYLPLGFHIPGTTQTKIAAAQLLPRIHTLELATLSLSMILGMVRRRCDLASGPNSKGASYILYIEIFIAPTDISMDATLASETARLGREHGVLINLRRTPALPILRTVNR